MDKIKNHDQILKLMTGTLLELKKLSAKGNSLSNIIMFLTTVISTAADLMELEYPGVATQYIYTEIEAAMKIGGLRGIRDFQIKQCSSSYSVSNIDDTDVETAMNYMGQELNTSLFKAIQELPLTLRTKEMLLLGIEVLLANLLYGKFKEDNPSSILEKFQEHVALMIKNLESKITKFPVNNTRKKPETV